MSVDPQASPGRHTAARGDMRLLFTYVNDQPVAVLYDAVNDQAGKTDAWETSTPAGGTTSFDRVKKLNGVKMQLKNDSPESYTFTATVPLRALGLKIQEGMRVKFDWGVLASDDGRSVKRRLYGSNQLATGTTDEAIEARLEPHLWGHVTFASKSKDEQRLSESLPEGKDSKKARTSVDDLLDDVKKAKP